MGRREAMEKGLEFFFTGKPCKHGHIAERYTKTWLCRSCPEYYRNVYSGKIKADDLGTSARRQAKEQGKTRYTTGRPCIRGHYAERHTSSGACAECARENRDRYGVDPDNLQKKRQYRSDHVEEFRAYTRNRRAKNKGNGGTHSPADIRVLFKLQKGRCALCAVDLKQKWHVDHRKALSRGGTNDRRNIQLLCGRCNRRKHAKDEISFSRELGKLL